MHCTPCEFGEHESCINKVDFEGNVREQPTTTWCACQHKEGVTLDSTQCKHLKVTDGVRECLNCGKHIPLTMTKENAINTLKGFVHDWFGTKDEFEAGDVLNRYAERFLNDRPIIIETPETPTSEM